MKKQKIVQVLTTLPNRKFARKLAHQAVLNKQAACVQIIDNVLSVYEWENKIEENEEVLLLFKILENQLESLFLWIKQNHPYQVPEIMAFYSEKTDKDYLNWIQNVLKNKEKEEK